MSGLVIRLLTCDGLDDGEVCDAELTAENGVNTLAQLRTIAWGEHQWSTRDGDYCPRHNPRKGGAA